MSLFSMISLTCHFKMLTKLLVFSLLFAISLCAPPLKSEEPSLYRKILDQRCIFPPEDLKTPPKCSEFTLLSQVNQTLYDRDNIEFYLCTALLDSINRLCPLVIKNRQFGERVKLAMDEMSLLNTMSLHEDGFCSEMDVLDMNTTMPQAKFFYSAMKEEACPSVCFGGKPGHALRVPLCKYIQFAHQQIRAAIDLQKSRNIQEQTDGKPGKFSVNNPQQPVVVKPQSANQVPSKNDESPSKIQEESLGVQSAVAIPNVDEKGIPLIRDSASQSKPVSQPKTIISQLEAKSAAGNAQNNPPPPKPALVVPPQEAAGNNKKTDVGKVNSALEASEKAESEDNAKALKKENGAVLDFQAEIPAESPAESPGGIHLEAQNVAEDNNQGEVPVEAQSEVRGEAQDDTQPDGDIQVDAQPPLTEDNDGTEDIRQELEDDGDDDLAGGGKLQESNKELAEKPPALEKKTPDPGLPLSITQQKVSQGLVTGGLVTVTDDDDSHFFAYFMSLSGLCVICYLLYHNKRKIIAMAVEGKKGRNAGRRRPNSASYHKLDSNLEEAMSSNLTSTNSYVIY